MADDKSEGRQPIPPAKRRILQKQFEHGSKMAASGNFDYATDLFFNCVVGDPGNRIYLQNYLGNLHRKYNNNKKGGKLAKLKGSGTLTGMKNAAQKRPRRCHQIRTGVPQAQSLGQRRAQRAGRG